VRPQIIDMDSINTTNSVNFISNGVREPYCSRRDTIHFTGTSGMQYLETNTVNITSGIVQFDLNMGCGLSTDRDFMIYVSWATNYGSNSGELSALENVLVWPMVQPFVCTPTTTGCNTWSGTFPPGQMSGSFTYGQTSSPSSFFSRDFRRSSLETTGWTRVTMPIPNGTFTGRRLRIYSIRNGNAEWAMSNIYIGRDCVSGCSGRGICVNGTCICDTNFTNNGSTCIPVTRLPGMLRDTFTNNITFGQWSSLLGAQVQLTGVVVASSGWALRFDGLSSRRITTIDLDTNNAEFAEFIGFVATDDYIFAYSSNGGLTWSYLASPRSQTPNTIAYYSVALPSAARTSATRFMFWQPTFSTSTNGFWVRAISRLSSLFLQVLLCSSFSRFLVFSFSRFIFYFLAHCVVDR
jgi:hypothetical protein